MLRVAAHGVQTDTRTHLCRNANAERISVTSREASNSLYWPCCIKWSNISPLAKGHGNGVREKEEVRGMDPTEMYRETILDVPSRQI